MCIIKKGTDFIYAMVKRSNNESEQITSCRNGGNMKISTKGRYAIRVMLDLAQQGTENYTPLMDIAKRRGNFRKVSGIHRGCAEQK